MTTTYKTWFHTRLATLIFPRQTLPSVFVYRAPDLSLMDKGTFSSAPGDTAHGSQCESPSPWNFKPLYPKTHPAHVHSAHLSSRSEFLTVSPFHRTSPNFAFFCLRSYLLPWWHLPRQGVFQARQKKKNASKITPASSEELATSAASGFAEICFTTWDLNLYMGISGETEPARLNSTISMGFFWDNTWATTVSMADLVVFAHPFDHSQLPEILRVVFLWHIWNHLQVANSLTVKQLYHSIRISLSSVHEFQNIRTKIFCKLQISIHNCLDLPPT